MRTEPAGEKMADHGAGVVVARAASDETGRGGSGGEQIHCDKACGELDAHVFGPVNRAAAFRSAASGGRLVALVELLVNLPLDLPLPRRPLDY